MCVSENIATIATTYTYRERLGYCPLIIITYDGKPKRANCKVMAEGVVSLGKRVVVEALSQNGRVKLWTLDE